MVYLENMDQLDQLCIHTITTKPLPIIEAIKKFSNLGVKGITIWQDAVKNISAKEIVNVADNEGMNIVSYCRGGFFPHTEKAQRQKAIENNLKMLDEAAALGAPQLVLVCGAHPDLSLSESRQQIQDGISALIDHAEKVKVRLSIEPLHPMYADTRSAINTLKQANDMAEAIHSEWVGIAIDVYHVWWDPDLETEIVRCGKNGHIFAFHVCDWKVPTNHLLLDRGLMGEGCIPIPLIRSWIEKAGFKGCYEVEIFSDHYWKMEQDTFLGKIVEAYKKYV